MRFRKSQIESAAKILQAWLGKRPGRGSNLHLHTIQHRWGELVGPELANRTQPLSLWGKTLKVAVANSAWLNELSFMRTAIIQRVNDVLRREVVHEIRLVTGFICPSPLPAKPEAEELAYVELPPEMIEEIEQGVASVLDPGLRDAIKKARMAQLVRALRHANLIE